MERRPDIFDLIVQNFRESAGIIGKVAHRTHENTGDVRSTFFSHEIVQPVVRKVIDVYSRKARVRRIKTGF